VLRAQRDDELCERAIGEAEQRVQLVRRPVILLRFVSFHGRCGLRGPREKQIGGAFGKTTS
jgi:hypothetical protein